MNKIHSPESKEQMAMEYSRLFFHSEVNSGPNEIEIQKKRLLNNIRAKGYDLSEFIEEVKTMETFSNSFDHVVIFSDGGVRQNHDASQMSVAGSAIVIYADKQLLKHDSYFIGDKIRLPSNQVIDINSLLAEYHGLMQALLFCKKYNVKANQFTFLTDCASMVQHLTVKLPQQKILRDYALYLRQLMKSLNLVELKHIPREYNKLADNLVNQLLDSVERSTAS